VLGARQCTVDRREVRDRLRFGRARFDIGRQPADAVIVADHDLIAPPAVVERTSELRLPLRRDRVLSEQPERMELSAGYVRGRVRRQRRGVDRHRKARLLHQASGRETDNARANHRDWATIPLQSELGCELGRAPAHRNATSAVAVIVDHALLPELLGADDETGASVGAQTRHGADDATCVHLDRHERRAA
jgi:hypothetical protein